MRLALLSALICDPVPAEDGRDDWTGNLAEPNKSLDAVLVTAVLLFVVAAALVFAGRLKDDQRMQLTAGSVGAAIGLLAGYGVGKLRP